MTPEDAKRVNDLCCRIYEGSCAGCCWHITLDDGNVEDLHVEFCIAEAAREGHPDCVALGPLMRAMTVAERAALTLDYDSYWQ